MASRGQQHNRSEGRWPANLASSSGASSDSGPGSLLQGRQDPRPQALAQAEVCLAG